MSYNLTEYQIEEILREGKFDKEKEYKEIIDCTKEQYGILMEDKNGN